ncbi:hypothetical protein EI555_015801, partial [Monodon monoceros]
AWVPRGLFRPCAGLSVQLSSTGIEQNGILANQVAGVTGSTDGIGFAMAQRLAQQNVGLAVAALQEEGLSTVGTMCHRGRQRPGAAGGHSPGALWGRRLPGVQLSSQPPQWGAPWA